MKYIVDFEKGYFGGGCKAVREIVDINFFYKNRGYELEDIKRVKSLSIGESVKIDDRRREVTAIK